MDDPWTVRGGSMDGSWCVHGHPWWIHGVSVVPMSCLCAEPVTLGQWCLHGESMVGPWTVHGGYMVSPWTVPGGSMDNPW